MSIPLLAGVLLASCSVSPDDPDEVFWEMFLRQAQQPVVHTRREYFTGPDQAAQRLLVRVQDEVHDYPSGRHTGANIEHWRGESRLWSKCVDGLQHSYDATHDRWSDPETNALCQISSKPFLGDGIIPGGLDAEQAEAMVAALQEPAHRFLSAHRIAAVHLNGRDYLRISVRARPIGRWDMQHLIFAFRETGLDLGEYPYQPADNTRAGADLTYYVDPATLLPAYAKRQSLLPGDIPGPVVRVEYVRPARYPTDPLADTKPWSLSWPATL